MGTGNFSGTVLRTKSLWTDANPKCDRSPPLQRGEPAQSLTDKALQRAQRPAANSSRLAQRIAR